MATARFLSKDQNWQEETTIYWFELHGEHSGTGKIFDGDVFGVVESDEGQTIVDSEGCPLAEGDGLYIAVSASVKVTDDMRSQQ